MCGDKWVAEACPQWRYESRIKMAGERATTRGTGFLGADGLIPALDLSGLYKYF